MSMLHKAIKIIKYIKNAIGRKIPNMKEDGVTALLGLTYDCQCNCVHCGMAIYKKDSSSELKTTDWLKIINGLPPAVKAVIFFGGEPTLRNDLPELISAAKKKGLRTTVDTNGYLLTNDFVGKLKNVGLDLCEISIDSPNPKTHDSLRGVKGTFDKVQDGIKNCKSKNLEFSISTYATKDNIKNGELKKVIDLARGLGAIYVRVLSPVLTGKWLNEDDLKLNDRERKNLNDILDGEFAFLEENHCIGINKQLIYISPYGEVQPCPYIPFAFGNINKESIENIIDEMWSHPIFKTKTKECLMNNKKFRNKYIKRIKTASKLPVDLTQK